MVSIRSYSDYHIDAIVQNSLSFRIILFYGHPRVNHRKESWDLLCELDKRGSGPWMIFGDFNEILSSRE